MTTERLRESFEAWYAGRCGIVPRRTADGYAAVPAQLAWEAWCNSAIVIAEHVRLIHDATTAGAWPQ